MKSSLYNTLRLSAALITVILLILSPSLPQRELSLIRTPDNFLSYYGDERVNDQVDVHWRNEAKRSLYCNLLSSGHRCGASLVIGTDSHFGLDLSSYEGLNFRLSYRGQAQHIRVYIRNFEPGVSEIGKDDSTKFMSTLISADDIQSGDVFLKYEEFATAEWWTLKWGVSGDVAKVNTDRLRSLGIEVLAKGDQFAVIRQRPDFDESINRDTIPPGL